MLSIVNIKVYFCTYFKYINILSSNPMGKVNENFKVTLTVLKGTCSKNKGNQLPYFLEFC